MRAKPIAPRALAAAPGARANGSGGAAGPFHAADEGGEPCTLGMARRARWSKRSGGAS